MLSMRTCAVPNSWPTTSCTCGRSWHLLDYFAGAQDETFTWPRQRGAQGDQGPQVGRAALQACGAQSQGRMRATALAALVYLTGGSTGARRADPGGRYLRGGRAPCRSLGRHLVHLLLLPGPGRVLRRRAGEGVCVASSAWCQRRPGAAVWLATLQARGAHSQGLERRGTAPAFLVFLSVWW